MSEFDLDLDEDSEFETMDRNENESDEEFKSLATQIPGNQLRKDQPPLKKMKMMSEEQVIASLNSEEQMIFSPQPEEQAIDSTQSQKQEKASSTLLGAIISSEITSSCGIVQSSNRDKTDLSVKEQENLSSSSGEPTVVLPQCEGQPVYSVEKEKQVYTAEIATSHGAVESSDENTTDMLVEEQLDVSMHSEEQTVVLPQCEEKAVDSLHSEKQVHHYTTSSLIDVLISEQNTSNPGVIEFNKRNKTPLFAEEQVGVSSDDEEQSEEQAVYPLQSENQVRLYSASNLIDAIISRQIALSSAVERLKREKH